MCYEQFINHAQSPTRFIFVIDVNIVIQFWNKAQQKQETKYLKNS